MSDVNNPTTSIPSGDILEIDLGRKTESVKLRESKTGEIKTYTIKEMSGLERDQWMNAMSKSFKVSADGKSTGIADYVGLHSKLIARCLYDESDKLVAEQVIMAWPATAQKVLFDKCQLINGLGEEGEQEVKKD